MRNISIFALSAALVACVVGWRHVRGSGWNGRCRRTCVQRIL